MFRRGVYLRNILLTFAAVATACLALINGSVLRETLFSPVFYIAVGGILFLEYRFPADPGQPLFSTGFFQDSVWLVLTLLFTGTVVNLYAKGLEYFHQAYLSHLDVQWTTRLPEPARFVLALLLGDFLAWFQHWLKHKVPWFWQIHAVHHSQRQMNMFTDVRFHYLEYIISKPIVVLPLMIFSVNTSTILGFGLFQTWYTRFYHANIRTNLGFLRYVLVTPQSHRVHHSIESRHLDRNFGVLFSFWDLIFRTHYNACMEYPKTGVKDAALPVESKPGFLNFVETPLRQLVYPFRAILPRRV